MQGFTNPEPMLSENDQFGGLFLVSAKRKTPAVPGSRFPGVWSMVISPAGSRSGCPVAQDGARTASGVRTKGQFLGLSRVASMS